MLKTNLSTRPFYNERAVYWALGLAFAAVLALTVFNVMRVMTLSARQATLSGELNQHEARIRELAAQTAQVRAKIDQDALERVIHAAQEANQVIDRRTFSWTELFNYLENTLPNGVMLRSVVPRVDRDGKLSVQLMVLGRDVEQIDRFIEAMEESRAFRNVLAGEERVTEEEQVEVRLDARYVPSSREAEAEAGAEADKPAAPAGGSPKDAATSARGAVGSAAEGGAP